VPDSPFNLQSARPAMDVYQTMFTMAADGIRAVSGFGDPQQWPFEWEQTYTRDAWLDQLPTQGTLTRLAPEPLTRVLDSVGTAIDTLGGSFTMPFTTVVVTARRTGTAVGTP
jgi:hypothetical protein